MKKGKKKNKKNPTIFTKIKAAMPNNRVLYSVLGGVGAGLALGTAIDKDKRQALTDKVTSTFQGLRRPTTVTDSRVAVS